MFWCSGVLVTFDFLLLPCASRLRQHPSHFFCQSIILKFNLSHHHRRHHIHPTFARYILLTFVSSYSGFFGSFGFTSCRLACRFLDLLSDIAHPTSIPIPRPDRLKGTTPQFVRKDLGSTQNGSTNTHRPSLVGMSVDIVSISISRAPRSSKVPRTAKTKTTHNWSHIGHFGWQRCSYHH